MSNTNQICSISEIINFLENRNFEKFRFANNYAYIYNSNIDEIVLEAPNHKISDEVIELAVKALNHLDKCVEYAYDWLNRMKDACDEDVELWGMCFEHFGYGHETKTSYDLGFTISFQLKNSTLNRIFTVKYCACSFLYGGEFAIEEWVQ